MTAPHRERLPKQRSSRTTEFVVGDCRGHLTVGEFDDGRPGEIFLKVSKEGSTLGGLMNAWAITFSLALQHGVPLETLVRTLRDSRFEPLGWTNDPDLPDVSSIVDYVVQRVALDYKDQR